MHKEVLMQEVGRLLYGGKATKFHWLGIWCKLMAFEKVGVTDDRIKAYILATSYHETGGELVPMYERGQGRGKPYGEKVRYDGRPYENPDQIYYGRGDVQLTWYENYERMGEILGIPLLENPELAMDTRTSALILVEGMTRGFSGRGDFTGLALEDFFNDRVNDPINARRVVNGRDQACRIAGYYEKFLAAIKAATLCLVLVLGMGLAGCKSPVTTTTTSTSTTHEVRRDTTLRFVHATATGMEQAQGWQHEKVVIFDTSAPYDSVRGSHPVVSERVVQRGWVKEKESEATRYETGATVAVQEIEREEKSGRVALAARPQTNNCYRKLLLIFFVLGVLVLLPLFLGLRRFLGG